MILKRNVRTKAIIIRCLKEIAELNILCINSVMQLYNKLLKNNKIFKRV